jgi:cytochrome c oxidase assembly protein subunit 15
MNTIRNFYKNSIITVILLYILVLVGGFVRITESGDDCPDWPKCYGSWFPPLSIEDIPEEFNPTEDKVYGSWIEYFNRLVGVILGISMLITFYKSIYIFKYDKIIFYGSLSSLLLIIIAGWFGGQIAQNIDGENIMHQHSVSIHLYIAILTIISLSYTTNRSFLLLYPDCEKKNNYSNESSYIFFAILILNLLLVFSGSFIRDFIDDDSIKQLPYFLRMERYVYETGFIKFIHPILGFSMLGLLGILWNHIMNISNSSDILKMFVKVLLILIGLQVIIGEGLRFNFIHETFRLYHLWISTVILGIIIISNQRIRHSK